ncbi:MAG: CxxC-x17-CxxC domain-containing protein [Candidatus Woesearchaeota archaeon]
MAEENTFEEYSQKGGSRRGPRRGGRDSGRGGFGRDRDSGRSRGNFDRNKRFGKNRRDLEMTKVICDECGTKCEVPFKPTSDKPIYCSKCFEKHDKKGGSSRSSGKDYGKDLELINEKLDKIMKALKVKAKKKVKSEEE